MRYKHTESILEQHVTPDCTVLDIGCGSSPYKDLFERYVGCDLPGNPYEKPGYTDIYCDGQALPFREGLFDLIFLVGVLFQIPDTQAVLSEGKRVLKDNGRILIFDYNRKTTARLKRSEAGGNNQYHVWSPFRLASIVRKAGFKASILYDYCTSEPTEKWKSLFWRSRWVRYLRFIAVEVLRREGWNIVIGRKV